MLIAIKEADALVRAALERIGYTPDEAVIIADHVMGCELRGVSFGGLVSVAFAAARPDRVAALVLASAPGPRWKPDARTEGYMRTPIRSIPSFVWRAAARLYPEVTTALPARGARLAFLARHVTRVLAAPMSPKRMADRVALAGTVDFVGACRRITAPTLVVAGEPELDRVVPVAGMADYLELIRNARFTTMATSGHIGMVTRAQAFASLVAGFVATGTSPERVEPDRRDAGKQTRAL